MKNHPIALLGIVFFMCVVGIGDGAAAAPSVQSTPAPRPKKPDFGPFAFLLGTWSCTSKEADRPGPSSTVSTYALDATGYWMTSKGDTPPVKWFPYDTKFQTRLTYDSDAKLWIFLYSDDLGGYNLATTPGWKNATAVWAQRSFFPTKDMTAFSNYTMKKISESKYIGTYTFTTSKASVVGGSDVCTKT